MLSNNKIQKICAEFGIGENISINKINQGVLNDNYILETSTGKYFVKSVREKAKDRLKTIYGTELFMGNKGVPSIAMLKTKFGEIFVSDDTEVYTLYPFIEGDKSGKYYEQDYRNMGEMLGKIHRTGSEYVSEIPDVKQFKRPNDQIILERLMDYRKLINNKSNQDEIDRHFLDYINFKLVAIPKVKTNELPNDTLIHGDYHPDNLLIDKNTREIIGVCDWEKSEFGPRSYELARSLLYTCFSDGYKLEEALCYSKKFLDGYLSVYPMDAEEIIDGLKMRIHRMTLSSWLEEKYYKGNDSRANHFISHEIDLIDGFVNQKLLEKIGELVKLV